MRLSEPLSNNQLDTFTCKDYEYRTSFLGRDVAFDCCYFCAFSML